MIETKSGKQNDEQIWLKKDKKWLTQIRIEMLQKLLIKNGLKSDLRK